MVVLSNKFSERQFLFFLGLVNERILFQVRCPLGNVIFNVSGFSCLTLLLSKVLILSSKPSTALAI